jgi:excisionase family DNA binding protein
MDSQKKQMIADANLDYMTPDETAAFLRISPRTLYRLYVHREGPPRIKYGRTVLYKRTSVVAWLDSREQAQPRANRSRRTAPAASS